MTQTINATLDRLKETIEANITTGDLNKTYDYRTFPDLLPITASLSYQGQGLLNGGTVAGDYVYYDIRIVIGAQAPIDEATGKVGQAEQRAADRALNTVETALYSLFRKGGTGNKVAGFWFKVSFPSPSVRPPSPIESPTTRWGEIPLRLHMR